MSSEAEVLDAGPTPRSRWRVVVNLVVLLVLLGIGVGAVLLDRSFRSEGSGQVAACRQQGAAEIGAAYRRLTARTGTVGPTVFAMPEGPLRQELLGLVSEAVAGADDRLQAARARCKDVDLLWYHGDLVRLRDDCISALEEMAAWFREVSRDGAHAFESRVEGGGCG